MFQNGVLESAGLSAGEGRSGLSGNWVAPIGDVQTYELHHADTFGSLQQYMIITETDEERRLYCIKSKRPKKISKIGNSGRWVVPLALFIVKTILYVGANGVQDNKM